MSGVWANLGPHFTNWQGVFRVMMMTPFLFVGFDVIPQVAEEIKVPPAALGKLVLFSIGLASVWYILVQWTVGFNLSAGERATSDLPTAQAMSAAYGSLLGGKILVLGGLLGIMTSWNAFFIGATRLLFAMSRGRMLPALFSRLHPRYQSPVAAVLLMGLLTMLAPLWGRPALVWLVDAGSLATVVAYVFVAASFLSIHRRYPHLPRPYRVRSPRLVGGLALMATLCFLLLYLPGSPSALVWPHEWAIVLAWAGLGGVLGHQVMGRLGPSERLAQAEAVLGDYAGLLAQKPSAEIRGEER